jgi:hypothetical protein
VLRDRGTTESELSGILVSTGGGPHAHSALRLACDIARATEGTLRVTCIFAEPEDSYEWGWTSCLRW